MRNPSCRPYSIPGGLEIVNDADLGHVDSPTVHAFTRIFVFNARTHPRNARGNIVEEDLGTIIK